MTRHQIELADFSAGRTWCSCGVVVDVTSEPLFDRNERLVNAWNEHRRPDGKAHDIQYDRDGRPQGFRLRREEEQ